MMFSTDFDSCGLTGAQSNGRSHRVRCRAAAHGFTLVELLVVVSIIALLISILLPSLKSARDQAKSVKCLAHCRGLAQSGLTFAQDHNGYFQLSSDHDGVAKADESHQKFEYTPEGELLAWPAAMAQASGMSGMVRNWDWGVRANGPEEAKSREEWMSTEFELATCPADRVRVSTPFYPRGTEDGMLVNPGDPENNFTADADTGYWGFLSYGINEDLVGAEIGGKKAAVGRYAMGLWATGEESQWAGERLQGNLDRIYDPGTVLLLVDSGPDSWKEYVESYGSTSSPLDGYVNLIISAKCDGPWLSNSQKRWPARVPVKRHPGGRVNVTFADFHAQTVKPVTWDVTVSLGKEFPYPKEHSAKVRVSPYKPFPD